MAYLRPTPMPSMKPEKFPFVNPLDSLPVAQIPFAPTCKAIGY
jgi:hypothetical protein